MSERTSYEPGVPCWVDLSTPDPEASASFYGGVFGWDVESAGPVEETGGYGMFVLGGKRVAGVGPIMQEGQPPVWSTYVATEDADGVAARAAQAGGSVLVEPMDVMDAGRMVFVNHPAGGVIGAWQAGRTIGAELVNEPGAVAWNELVSRDVAGAKAFFEAVFGWQPDDQDYGETVYTLFNVAGRPVAGGLTTPDAVPAEAPSAFWLTYFGVEDCDASVAKVQELGGSLRGPILEMEGVGRFAVVADPHGATFGVIAGAQPDE
jgi:predicted enzyme related to lactoylglutathione lyase